MADIFTPQDVHRLLSGRSVLLIGDSNIRGIYKDLVWLSENCSYLPQKMLKAKLEQSYMGDALIEGAQAPGRGRDFREVRQYRSRDGTVCVCFMFCTRVYSDYMSHLLQLMQRAPPDVIIVNSCVWDISRWGPTGVDAFKQNLPRFLEHVRRASRPDTQLIWLTAMPVSTDPRGGFLVKQVEFLRHTLRFDVMEANQFCASVVQEYGYDVLDLHYHFRCLIHHRNRDGIHWSPRAVRSITNLVLNHVCLSWNRQRPMRGPLRLMQRLAASAQLSDSQVEALSGFPLSATQLASARCLSGDCAPRPV